MKKSLADFYQKMSSEHLFTANFLKGKYGNQVNFQDFLAMSAQFAKKAAILCFSEGKDLETTVLYLRSAAWMSFNTGNYEDAVYLSKLGIAQLPNEFEESQFQEIIEKVKPHFNPDDVNLPNSELHFYGTLTDLNLDQRKLSIRKNGEKKYIEIVMPDSFDSEIVGPLFGSFVEVEAKKDEEERIILGRIKLAA